MSDKSEVITFRQIDDYIESVINDSVQSFGHGLVSFVVAPLFLAATVYFLLLGIAVLRGAIQSPMRELVYQIGKVGLVLAAASSIGYTTFVVNIATHLPSEIISAGSGQSATNMGSTFDNYVVGSQTVTANISAANERIQDKAITWDNLGYLSEKISSLVVTYIAIAIIYLFAAASACVGFVINIYAQFALAICVALAPLALACLLFDSSRWLFDGWLHQTANYILLSVVMAIMTKFITGLEAKVMGDFTGFIGRGDIYFIMKGDFAFINSGAVMFGVLSCIIIYLIGTMFFFQSPSIAAGIAGGAASGGHGFLQSGMNMAAGKLLSRKGGGGNSGDGGGGGKVKRG